MGEEAAETACRIRDTGEKEQQKARGDRCQAAVGEQAAGIDQDGHPR